MVWYGGSHYNDKTVSRPTHIYYGNPHTWKDRLYIDFHEVSLGYAYSGLLVVICPLVWYEIVSYASVGHVDSFDPTYAIWRHWSGPTLAQVMAYCLTAPSYYLNRLLAAIPVKCHRKCTNYAVKNCHLKIHFWGFLCFCQGTMSW